MFSSSAPETDSPRSPTASPPPAMSTVAWWTPAAICPPTERLRLLPSARSSSLDLPLRGSVSGTVERFSCDRSARSAYVREVGLVDCARGDDVGVDAGARLVRAADRLEQLRPRFEPGLAVAHHDATRCGPRWTAPRCRCAGCGRATRPRETARRGRCRAGCWGAVARLPRARRRPRSGLPALRW